MSTTRSARSASSESGAGLVGTLAGVVVFLALLLLAVQVVYGLYARSAVTAAAFDAARAVAGADAQDRPAAAAEAEARAREILGGVGDQVSFAWSADVEVVSLRVQAQLDNVVPATVRRPLGLDVIDRTIHVRVERPR